MELKRILARDTRSANEKAMQLYGEDVLVISTQRVGDQTELIVAIDANALVNQQSTSAHLVQSQAPSSSEKEEVFAEIFGFVQRQEKMIQTDVAESPLVVPMSVPSPAGTSVVSADSNHEPALKSPRAKSKPKLDTRSSPARSSVQTSGTPNKSTRRTSLAASESDLAGLLQQELARSREIVDLLRQEVGVLRREFSLARQAQPWESGLQMAPDVRALADQMMAIGVPTGLRMLLTDALLSCSDVGAAQLTLKEVLNSHLSACVSGLFPRGCHALVGPSGAGKTSMAVRLAHMHSDQHGVEQQAIISFADKRPGAWSQLQTMAASVGVEVYRAQDPDALRVLLAELGYKTHVWIDTPAQAHFEVAPVLMDSHLNIRCHAVAPMDASVASMQRLQACLQPWASLMLTKADECDVVWHWIQALSQKPVPISFVSRSDQIKVAAEGFVPEQWVDRALDSLQLKTVEVKTKKKTEAKATAKTKTPTRTRRSVATEKVAHG